ncbi:MAG TPA: lysylphosphatidylglycerol synthase domain-containing protein [Acidimicrobiia bacterium]|nr:lysylphosphatidylglycerol synthase domain-containing protein [Acidimicrobiia bacterium]
MAKTIGGTTRPAPRRSTRAVRDSVAVHRARLFGPASEQPYRRRTTDWVRLVVAVGLSAWSIERQGTLTTNEKNLFTFFNQLPGDLHSLFSTLYRAGALWAVGVVAVAALVGRRWRLARDLAIAGIAAWFVARLVGVLVVEKTSLLEGLDVVTRLGRDTASFPLVRLAIIVAVISTAAPYLSRPMRRVGQVLVLLMALAAMYLGAALPDAILAGMVLGWGVAAGVHLAFGSPGGRPTRAHVALALEELRVPVDDVELCEHQTYGSTLMSARDAGGRLDIRVLGRDEADAQLLGKLWRTLLYKESAGRVHLTRLEDVEHEAYALLLAGHNGVAVPDVVVAGSAGPGAALVATRPVEGPRLADVEPASVDDSLLDALWEAVGRLHDAALAHGRLNARHIVVGTDGPALADFRFVVTAADAQAQAADVAELLTSTATIVGDERAVAAAVRGLGADAVAAILPVLQPAALSPELRPRRRRDAKKFKEHVGNVRDAAASALGIEAPPLQTLYRVSATNLLMAVGSLIAVFALLGQVGSFSELWDTIQRADWGWLSAALVVSFLTNFATAVSLMGTVPIRLPLVRTAELQLSMSFSNLAVPAVGGMAAQIRFLQKQGLDLASAVASGGLLANAGNITASLLLFGLAAWLSPRSFSVGNIPTDSIASIVLIAGVVLVIGLALVLGVPKLRRLVVPPVKSALTTIWEALRSPRRVALLMTGNMVNALMYGFVLLACVRAFGGDINFWSLLTVNIGVGTIASLIPIPGGGTAVSSVGLSGALVAFGIPTEVAVAAVLANQLVTSFLPAVPGWTATQNLLHDGYL